MKKSTILALCAGALMLITVAAYTFGFKHFALMATDESRESSGSVSIINEYIAVEPEARIEISTTAGSVRIESVESDTLHVSGTLGGNVLPLHVERSADRIGISAVLREKMRFMQNGSINAADLRIKVPAGRSLVITTVSADIVIVDYSGPRIECATVSGNVMCGGTVAQAVIKTVSGDIERNGKAQDVRAETISGDVTVFNETDGSYFVKTVSGALELHGGLRSNAELDVETTSGDVKLSLPAEVSARFTLASMSGSIRNDIPHADTYRDDAVGCKRMQGTFGTGGGNVSVRTQSGDITVKRLVLKKPGV